MKSFLKWTGIVVGVGAAGVFAFRAVQSGRARLRSALGHAEAIADRTRATLAETQAALDYARRAV